VYLTAVRTRSLPVVLWVGSAACTHLASSELPGESHAEPGGAGSPADGGRVSGSRLAGVRGRADVVRTAACLVLLESDPKTLRVRLQLLFDDVSCEEVHPSAFPDLQTIRASHRAAVPGEFRAPCWTIRAAAADPWVRDSTTLEAHFARCTNRLLRDVFAALDRWPSSTPDVLRAWRTIDQAGV